MLVLKSLTQSHSVTQDDVHVSVCNNHAIYEIDTTMLLNGIHRIIAAYYIMLLVIDDRGNHVTIVYMKNNHVYDVFQWKPSFGHKSDCKTKNLNSLLFTARCVHIIHDIHGNI